MEGGLQLVQGGRGQRGGAGADEAQRRGRARRVVLLGARQQDLAPYTPRVQACRVALSTVEPILYWGKAGTVLPYHDADPTSSLLPATMRSSAGHFCMHRLPSHK